MLNAESWLARALSLPASCFFGEISCTIYLVHRPLLLAMTGTLATYDGFAALPAVLRFILLSAGLLVITTLVSWLLYSRWSGLAIDSVIV